MRWEVRKLLGSRFLVLLALALLAVNALLFYQHAGQGDLAQIQVLYDRRGELEPLRDDLLERALAGEDPYDDSLLTGDIYQELSLVEAALDRITPVERFPEIRPRPSSRAACSAGRTALKAGPCASPTGCTPWWSR